MSDLTWNRYGKSRIRLVKVRRDRADPHELVDLTIDVQLEGAFEAVYVDGDNGPCLATDTMKNTVYALARQDPIDHVETFALRLAEHFRRASRRCRACGSARSSSRGDVCRPAAGRIRTRSCRPARSTGRRWSRATRSGSEIVVGPRRTSSC